MNFFKLTLFEMRITSFMPVFIVLLVFKGFKCDSSAIHFESEDKYAYKNEDVPNGKALSNETRLIY